MHPVRGLLPPGEFIPVAEQSGLIKPLSEWVAAAAIHQCSLWRGHGRILPVAINLSMVNLRDPEFAEILRRLLERSGIQPRELVIEITESALMIEPTRTG